MKWKGRGRSNFRGRGRGRGYFGRGGRFGRGYNPNYFQQNQNYSQSFYPNYSQQNDQLNTNQSQYYYNRNINHTNNTFPGECYRCHKIGHKAADCPTNEESANYTKRLKIETNEVNKMQADEDNEHEMAI